MIVGGGTAAMSGLMGIRQNDKKSDILVISEEEKFYSRTPLSKALWRSNELQLKNYRYKSRKGKEVWEAK